MRVKIKKIGINEYKVETNKEIKWLEFKDIETGKEITRETRAVRLSNGRKFKGSRLEVPETYKELPVTKVGVCAFYNCKNLEEITLPDSVTEIGDNAFDNCTNLKEVILPDSIMKIGNGTFYNCKNLKGINISSSVREIDKYAFIRCINLRQDIKDELINKWGCVI